MNLIGIIAAMEEEAKEIKKTMQEYGKIEEIHYYEKQFLKGKIENKNCVLVKSGVGKVNAARTTQLLIDYFSVDAIINVGSAGALNEKLDYGDIIVSTACIQHDFDITCFGHPKGYITDLGVQVKADETLVKRLEQVIQEQITEEKLKIKDEKIMTGKLVTGIIATGDQFYNSPEIKRELRKEFHAECDDMEGAAIAQVCYLCHIPFVIIRSISDKPKTKEKVDFYEYLEMASKRCAFLVREFLKKL